MPIYEYRCSNCHRVFEEWCRRVDDEQEKPCPVCNHQADRIISNTSFALKGSGWYATEYGSRKGPSTTQEGGASESSSSVATAPSTSGNTSSTTS